MSNQTTKTNYRVFSNSILSSNDIVKLKNELLISFLNYEDMKNRAMDFYKEIKDLKKEIGTLKRNNFFLNERCKTLKRDNKILKADYKIIQEENKTLENETNENNNLFLKNWIDNYDHGSETLDRLESGDYEIDNFMDFLMEIKGVREYLNKYYFITNK